MAIPRTIVAVVTALVVQFIVCVNGQLPSRVEYRLDEGLENGTYIGNLLHNANLHRIFNSSMLDQLTFRFLTPPAVSGGGKHVPFTVQSPGGDLQTGAVIDREAICGSAAQCLIRWKMAVGPRQDIHLIDVFVSVVDKNDNSPVFAEKSIQFRISEAVPRGTKFLLPSAADADSERHGVKRYELVSRTTDVFALETEGKMDGSMDVKLQVVRSLDREQMSTYLMTLRAYDGGVPPRVGELDIKVTVVDSNDVTPVWDNTTYSVTIPEDTAPLTSILTVHATDNDEGRNGRVVYGLSPRTRKRFGHLFQISNTTGQLFLIGRLDYEKETVYHLGLTASDQGQSALQSDALVIVYVTDINDFAPAISVNTLAASETSTAEVDENSAVGTFVAHAQVSDGDSGPAGVFNCSLKDDHFSLLKVSPSDFKIVTTQPLDRESMSEYNLVILCKDQGLKPQVSVKNLKVLVTDLNDNSPQCAKQLYTRSIEENSPVGSYLLTVNASDRDDGRNAQLSYSIPGPAGNLLQVDALSGLISVKAPLDREELGQRANLRVLVTDNGQKTRLTGTCTIVITLLDVNDVFPTFEKAKYTFGVYENVDGKARVGTVRATDPDLGDGGKVTYSLVKTGDPQITARFSVDAATGRITTRTSLDRESVTSYSLVVMASDHGEPVLSSTVDVTVYVADKNDNKPVIDWPHAYNHTLVVSKLTPQRYALARIQAHDWDSGDNARLTYRVLSGNELGLVRLDPQTGLLTAARDFSSSVVDDLRVQLKFTVQDNGTPSLRSEGYLTIAINMTSPVLLPGHTTPSQREGIILVGQNLVIVVTLSCISGVIIVILIIAILLLRRQSLDRSVESVSSKSEETSLFTLAPSRSTSNNSEFRTKVPHENQICTVTKENNMYSPVKESQVYPLVKDNLHAVSGQKQKRGVSFSTELQLAPLTAERHRDLQRSEQSSQHKQCSHHAGAVAIQSSDVIPVIYRNEHTQAVTSPQLCGAPPPVRPPVSQPVYSYATRHQLPSLDSEPDSESSLSNEGSNTDSGRGPSEEGEPRAGHMGHVPAVPPRPPGGHRAARESVTSRPSAAANHRQISWNLQDGTQLGAEIEI